MKVPVPLLSVLAFLLAYGPVQAEWFETKRHGDVVYCFFDEAPYKIERYSLATREWLSTLSLPDDKGAPTAAHVDEDGIYVAYGAEAYRYDLDAGDQRFVGSLFDEATDILTSGDVMIYTGLGNGGFVASALKTSNTLVDIEYYSIADPVLDEENGLVTGVTESRSAVRYDASGSLSVFEVGGMPIWAPTSAGSLFWRYPGGSRGIDRFRRVWDVERVVSLGVTLISDNPQLSVDDAVFYGPDIAVLLQGESVTVFGNDYLKAGDATLPLPGRKMYIVGEDVVVFMADEVSSTRVLVSFVALGDLNAPAPGSPVDPVGIDYTPESVFVGNDGKVYLLSSLYQSLFCWDPVTQKYEEGFQFEGIPTAISYMTTTNELYVLYSDNVLLGRITRILMDPNGGWSEEYVTDVPVGGGRSHIMAARDTIVTITDRRRRSFDRDGNELGNFLNVSYDPHELLWNSARDFFFALVPGRGIYSWNIAPNGVIGPLIAANESSGVAPLRVSPDGSLLVTGDGSTWSFGGSIGTLLKRSQSVVPDLTDMVWASRGGNLRTMRSVAEGTRLEAWDQSDLSLGATRDLPGEPYRLLSLGDNTLVAILIGDDGVPVFYRLSINFDVMPPASLAAPAGLGYSFNESLDVVLVWNDVDGESDFRIERRLESATSWEEVGTTGTSVTTFVDEGAEAGSVYEYRVFAVNGSLESPPSSNVEVSLTAPDAPPGFVMRAIDLDFNRSDIWVEGQWGDVSNETGYVVQYRTSGSSQWDMQDHLEMNDTLGRWGRLSALQEYEFRISAENPFGRSAWTHAFVVTLPHFPYNSSNVWVEELRSYQALLRWSIRNVTDESVLQRRTPGGAWTTVFDGVGDEYLDRTVVEDTSYEYRVKTRNVRGESEYSDVFRVNVPALHVPDPPSSLSLRNVEGGGVLIEWETFFVTDAVLIERRTDGPADWEVVATVPAGEGSSFLDQGVLPDYKYDYRLSALNTAGASDYVMGSIVVIDGVCLLAGDFDDGLEIPWTSVSGGEVIVNGGQGFPSGGVLWMGESGIRSFKTGALDVSRGGVLELRFRGGNADADGYEFWDDSEEGERVHVQYSSDGVLWFGMGILDPAVVTDWADFALEIPWEARSQGTHFRLVQESNSGPAFDTWAIDHFCVFGHRVENVPPVFAAHTPAVLSANAAGDPLVLDLKQYVSDPNTLDRLYYAIEEVSNPGLFSAFGVGLTDGVLKLEFAPYVTGSSEVTLRVTDEAGAEARWTITINGPGLDLPVITREGPIELNLQTALYEQSLTITNNGDRAIGGFYLRVTGLGTDYTVYGVADDTIHYASPVEVGQSVVLQLEYYSPTLSVPPSPSFELSLFAPDPPVPVQPPGRIGAGLYRMADGAILYEFEAIPGRRYRVQYSGDMATWIDSPTIVTAGGSRVQWLDQGPPRTSSHPSEEASRYYRAVEVVE